MKSGQLTRVILAARSHQWTRKETEMYLKKAFPYGPEHKGWTELQFDEVWKLVKDG